MKLQEAIKEVASLAESFEYSTDHNIYPALKLLIEAGKRLLAAREGLTWRDDLLLPGETKE